MIDNPKGAATWAKPTYGWPGPQGYEHQFNKLWQRGLSGSPIGAVGGTAERNGPPTKPEYVEMGASWQVG